MLQKEKDKRLGAKKDFTDVKTHEFFSDVNWDELDDKKVRPPFNPNVVSAYFIDNIFISKNNVKIITKQYAGAVQDMTLTSTFTFLPSCNKSSLPHVF